MLENIRLALRGIITHKMRSFLTMLGVIIGIASIIGIVSIVQGTNARLEKSLIGAGNNVVTVALSENGANYDLSNLPSGVPVVSDEAMERINKLSGVRSASTYRQRDSWAAQVYNGKYTLSNGKIVGASKNLFETLAVTNVLLIKFRAFTCDLLDAVNHHLLGIIEIVSDHHIVSCIQKLHNRVASDKSCSACH